MGCECDVWDVGSELCSECGIWGVSMRSGMWGTPVKCIV